MDAVSAAPSPPPILPPRPRTRGMWQFSLRELLLLTLVAGLSLTIWRLVPGKLEPTSFLNQLSVSRAVDDALLELTGAARVSTTEIRHVVAGYRPHAEEIGIKHICLCRFPPGTDPPPELLPAIKKRLTSLLADAECEVVEEGVTPKVNSPRFPQLGFYINYRHRRMWGLVNVDVVPRGSDVEIYVLVHEFPDR